MIFRLPQNLSKKRAKALTPEVAKEFYHILQKKMIKINVLDRPESIFNCDESGYMGSFGRSRCFARRSDRNSFKLSGDNEKMLILFFYLKKI